MQVERRFCRVGLGQDAVDPHRANAFRVEEVVGGIEQPLAHAVIAGFRFAFGHV